MPFDVRKRQAGYLVSGHMDLTIGSSTHIGEPGDRWCGPGDVGRSAVVHVDSVAIEIFYPVREDYLPSEGAT